MSKPVVIEAARKLDASGTVFYRFVCSSCSVEGAWHESLTDAERSGERHQRVKHQEAVSA